MCRAGCACAATPWMFSWRGYGSRPPRCGMRADSASLKDVRFIDRRFGGGPGSGVVSGEVRLRSHGARVLEVGLDPLRLTYDGGTVTGRLTAFSAADSGLVA